METNMYSLAEHWQMLADHVRGAAYEEALRRSVGSESTVLDIGTGTGAFALLACAFGARHVYAVEYDDSIEVARTLARENGVIDRITFIRGLSTDVSLPEGVDVIVSDLRGVLPLHGRHLPSVADARRRFLNPGGVLIPRSDTIWAALLQSAETYRALVAPWREGGRFDLEPARRLAVNRWSKIRAMPDQLLGGPQPWVTLDYARIDEANVAGDLHVTVQKPGVAHGWCLWFESTLVDGVAFSSAPGQPELIYGNGFFPLTDPVAVDAGDVVSLSLQANLVGNEYVWRWATVVREGGEAGATKAAFNQSNFQAAPLSVDELSRGSTDAIPTLSEDGRVDQTILSLMSGELSIGAIAERVAATFPARFPAGRDALPRVREIARRSGA